MNLKVLNLLKSYKGRAVLLTPEGLCMSGNTTTRVVPDSERGSLLELIKALPVPSYLDFMT